MDLYEEIFISNMTIITAKTIHSVESSSYDSLSSNSSPRKKSPITPNPKILKPFIPNLRKISTLLRNSPVKERKQEEERETQRYKTPTNSYLITPPPIVEHQKYPDKKTEKENPNSEGKLLSPNSNESTNKNKSKEKTRPNTDLCQTKIPPLPK